MHVANKLADTLCLPLQVLSDLVDCLVTVLRTIKSWKLGKLFIQKAYVSVSTLISGCVESAGCSNIRCVGSHDSSGGCGLCPPKSAMPARQPLLFCCPHYRGSREVEAPFCQGRSPVSTVSSFVMQQQWALTKDTVQLTQKGKHVASTRCHQDVHRNQM